MWLNWLLVSLSTSPWRQADVEKSVLWDMGIASAPLKLTLDDSFSGLCGGAI